VRSVSTTVRLSTFSQVRRHTEPGHTVPNDPELRPMVVRMVVRAPPCSSRDHGRVESLAQRRPTGRSALHRCGVEGRGNTLVNTRSVPASSPSAICWWLPSPCGAWRTSTASPEWPICSAPNTAGEPGRVRSAGPRTRDVVLGICGCTLRPIAPAMPRGCGSTVELAGRTVPTLGVPRSRSVRRTGPGERRLSSTAPRPGRSWRSMTSSADDCWPRQTSDGSTSRAATSRSSTRCGSESATDRW
jgi:hypothetical protein